MRRVYTLTIEIEAEFAAKIKSSSWKTRIRERVAKILPSPWKISKTSIRTRVEREAQERVPTEREIRKEEILLRARRIVREIKDASPRLPRPINVRWIDKGCRDGSGGYAAHAHRGQWYRYDPTRKNQFGRGKRIRLPRNLICLENFVHIERSYPKDWNLASLLCHEIAHLATKRGHGTGKFHEIKKRIFERWEARFHRGDSAASA